MLVESGKDPLTDMSTFKTIAIDPVIFEMLKLFVHVIK